MEGELLTTITELSDKACDTTFNNQLIHRIFESLYKSDPHVNSLQSEGQNTENWSDNFVKNFPEATRIYVQKVIDKELKGSFSNENFEQYFKDKVDLESFSKQITKKCLELSVTNIALNQHVLTDLGKVEELYSELSDRLMKNFSTKTTKLQNKVNTLEKLLKNQEKSKKTAKPSAKDGESNELGKLKLKILSLQKENSFLMNKCQTLELSNKDFLKKNCELLRERAASVEKESPKVVKKTTVKKALPKKTVAKQKSDTASILKGSKTETASFSSWDFKTASIVAEPKKEVDFVKDIECESEIIDSNVQQSNQPDEEDKNEEGTQKLTKEDLLIEIPNPNFKAISKKKITKKVTPESKAKLAAQKDFYDSTIQD